MREYLMVIFAGLVAIFLYNYFASLLRALGNSMVPLLFLALSAVLNILLDLWFVLGLGRGVGGAAEATVIAQYVAGIGIAAYTLIRFPGLWRGGKFRVRLSSIREIAGFSALTCVQQSGDEPRHPDGAGIGEQFRRGGDGGFCRCGQDRRLRLYAGAGFRQRLLHLYRPELWRRGGKTHPVGTAGRDPRCDALLPCDHSGNLAAGAAADAALCRCKRDRDHRRGGALSPYRGQFLLWNRLSVPALRASTARWGGPGCRWR